MRRLHIPLYLGDVAAREGRDDLRDWVASLPAVVSELTERWALQLGAPYEPGGQCSWVAPARNRSGEDLVLKVGWRHSEAANEADGLRYWRDDGTVRLHAAEVIDQTSALLLERCDPGTPLGRSMPEPEQDVVVAGLLRRLWTQPPDGHPFRPLQTMCEEWAGEFEHGFMGSSRGIDPGLAREAMVLFRELPSSAGRTVLLCTDLHGENILAARREPWLVIDPKPYVGDPTYDPLQHMLNCEERLTADPLGFARRIAALLDLDAERLRLWLFARCMQECLDQPVLYDIAARLAPK